MKNSTKIKILVMKFRNIGDVLLATPLLTNLKHHFPNSTIGFALNKGCEDMITQNKNVDTIHIYDRKFIKSGNFLQKIKKEIAFAKEIKKEKYDMVVQLTEGDRGILIAKFANIKTIISPKCKNILIDKFITHKIPKPTRLTHTIDRNLDALKPFFLDVVSKKVQIYFDKVLLKDIDLPQKFIHVHPVSRWMFKSLNEKVLAEIIDFCQNDLKIKVVLTADKNEVELSKISSILAMCKSTPINLSGSLSLKEVSALSKRSLLFIGVDTAIMHIAAANDVPVVAFFGPSGAFEWGPWDNSLFISGYIKKNGNARMGKHIVFQKNWECVPCGKAGCDNCGISECLVEFSTQEIEQVKKAIKEKLKPYLSAS